MFVGVLLAYRSEQHMCTGAREPRRGNEEEEEEEAVVQDLVKDRDTHTDTLG